MKTKKEIEKEKREKFNKMVDAVSEFIVIMTAEKSVLYPHVEAPFLVNAAVAATFDTILDIFKLDPIHVYEMCLDVARLKKSNE